MPGPLLKLWTEPDRNNWLDRRYKIGLVSEQPNAAW